MARGMLENAIGGGLKILGTPVMALAEAIDPTNSIRDMQDDTRDTLKAWNGAAVVGLGAAALL